MTKALIVLLFAAVAACQLWVVPQIAAGFAAAAPEFAALELPGVLMVGALLLCVQVVLVCVWRLLTLAARESIFDAAAFRWVDAIIATVVIAGVLIVAGMVVIDRAQAGSPFILITGIIALITVAGLALVVVVMRGLLRQATLLRQEMAEVV
ncbi:DUF2975 domain-containing protein [Microbacter sp. GSS18]|nr:DUF2975 domain-containing protein [Microbacter sp. GSS18]